jgi:CrcB protein
MLKVLSVFIGGGLGSVLRYAVGLGAASFATSFPLGTLLANVFATAIMAWGLVYLTGRADVSSWVSLLVITGFCGGFSTFSTFSVDTVRLYQQGFTGLAVANVAVNVVVCVVIAALLLKRQTL